MNPSLTLRFQCTGCGRCCTGVDDEYVFLGAGEAEAIRGFLGLSRPWFRRRYLSRFDDSEVLASTADGRCIFLQPDNNCRIYAVRPVQCGTYPFWPELMEPRAWAREARRCEGIGRGDEVPADTVRLNLRLIAALDELS